MALPPGGWGGALPLFQGKGSGAAKLACPAAARRERIARSPSHRGTLRPPFLKRQGWYRQIEWLLLGGSVPGTRKTGPSHRPNIRPRSLPPPQGRADPSSPTREGYTGWSDTGEKAVSPSARPKAFCPLFPGEGEKASPNRIVTFKKRGTPCIPPGCRESPLSTAQTSTPAASSTAEGSPPLLPQGRDTPDGRILGERLFPPRHVERHPVPPFQEKRRRHCQSGSPFFRGGSPGKRPAAPLLLKHPPPSP